ncbi:MAG TPA: Fic family protein [Dehalococcoidia bacterium]|nr:Fic family protein [Dehalococcoidia bacterium]
MLGETRWLTAAILSFGRAPAKGCGLPFRLILYNERITSIIALAVSRSKGCRDVLGTYVRKTWAPDPHLYAPARFRRGCSYDAFCPAPLSARKFNIPGELAAAISDAESAIAGLNVEGARTLAPLGRLLLRTESIASSKVEGLQMDARTLACAEAKDEAGRKIGADAAEILASINSMELAVERASEIRRFAVADLVDIHRALLGRSAPKIAGSVRTVQNWIGGNDYNPCDADFVPPPPEQLPALLDDVCAFCNEESLPPLVQAAIAHAQFETIHPFEDGNGRTGRALVQVILRRRGLAPAYVPPISVMLARRKQPYIKGLVRYRDDDVDGWLTMFAEASASAARLARLYLGRVRALQEDWRRQLGRIDPRSDAAAWSVIDILPGSAVITVSAAIAGTGRSRPAAVHALDQLTQCGVLLPLTESPRNRSWEAAGLLDLIVGLEEGEPL